MSENKMPFQLTENIIQRVAAICEQVGRITGLTHGQFNTSLRETSRIRTIQAVLAMEGTSLSLDQVTAIIQGRRILGNPNEIKEVQNAYAAYEECETLNPISIENLLKAHKQMMDGVIPDNGSFRTGGVDVLAGDTVAYLAPPATAVPRRIQEVLDWYDGSAMHPLIKSAIFRYEFACIHPFADGNGRMGHLWHKMLLGTWRELFYWLPIEPQIWERKQDYYMALRQADTDVDCHAFVEFMLQVILDAMQEPTRIGNMEDTVAVHVPDTVQALLAVLGDECLSAKDLMVRLGLSHRPTFRKNYLNPALHLGVIKMTLPDRPRSRNQRYLKAI